MSSLSDFDPSAFSGQAPLFPLPGVVLFPGMTIPLHIFEHRYRQMTADALEGEQLIALALLAPGWELDYEGRPEIHEMVCLGRMVAHERLPDGKYNLMLRGLMRAVVIEELPVACDYRVAQLELYRDFYPREPVIDRERRVRELLLGFRKLLKNSEADALAARLLDVDVPLGDLCDFLAPILRCDAADRQELLEEVDVDQRSDRLLMALRRELAAANQAALSPVYPPAFSLN